MDKLFASPPFDLGRPGVSSARLHTELSEGGAIVIRSMKLDTADPTKLDPKRIYHVTVIFCLRPGRRTTYEAIMRSGAEK